MSKKLVIGVGALIVVVIAAGLVVWLMGLGGGDSRPVRVETTVERARDIPVPAKAPNRFPNANSGVNDLVGEYESGQSSAEEVASKAPLHWASLVAVEIHVDGGVDELINTLEANGAILMGSGETYIEAYVPVSYLSQASTLPGVIWMQPIVPPAGDNNPSSQPAWSPFDPASEHRATSWHNEGYRGEGVKIGIIDTGFIGFSSHMGTELPESVHARCFLEDPTLFERYTSDIADCEYDEEHGTAVAEALFDFAPGATFYISQSTGKAQLRDTVDWMISEGVTVINMSLGYVWDGPGDGTSPFGNSLLKTVDHAVDSGIIWVTSAGNDANGDVWTGEYNDADSNGWIEFSADCEPDIRSPCEDNRVSILEGSTFIAELRWDDPWGRTASAKHDLDLYLYDSQGEVVQSSRDRQRFGQASNRFSNPYEMLSYTVPAGKADVYSLRVTYRQGRPPLSESDPPVWIQLRSFTGADGALNYATPERSIGTPADSGNPGMLAVGAIAWDDWEEGDVRDYSSRGPTLDRRNKPDIVGSDGGYSAVKERYWPGTSQAAPHVAGLAVLVRQRYSDLSPAGVANFLKHRAAVPEGVSVPNDEWGYGFAQLTTDDLTNAPLQEPTPQPKPTPTPVVTSGALVSGTVLFNGRPLSEFTDKTPQIWAASWEDRRYPSIEISYDTSTGEYAIRGLPPGGYDLGVYVDVSQPFDGELGMPLDFLDWKSLDILVDQTVFKFDIDLPRVIRLNRPVDSINGLTNEEDPAIHPGGPLQIAWDPIDEADSYVVQIEKNWADNRYAEGPLVDFNETVFSTSIEVDLPISDADEWYELSVYAYDSGGRVVGQLVIEEGGYVFHYDFRIAGPEAPAPAATPQPTPPADLSFASISAGWAHTCGVTKSGNALCWGRNDYGQATPPVGVSFESVSAGSVHTCGVTTSGDALCWGHDNEGQATPPAGVSFASVSTGWAHTCGVTTSGNALCWGRNDDGQATPPVGVSFASVSAGWQHTCGVTKSGNALCWGRNDDGQATPPAGVSFASVSAGWDHTCGVTTSGDALCWGDDGQGQATSPAAASFASVSAGDDYTCGVTTSGDALCWGNDFYGRATPPAGVSLASVSVGDYHTCGVTTAGDAICWGDDGHGQATPPAGVSFASVSAGGFHTCGMTTSGDALCWGEDSDGQATPPAGMSFASVSAGGFHTCGMTTSGDALCWGRNDDGQATPPSGVSFASVSAGTYYTCGVTTSGDALCWGRDNDGQARPPSGVSFTSVSAGWRHTCGVTTAGDALCWGRNDYGQATPPSGVAFASVSAGYFHTCGVTTSGDALCWGRNDYGQATPPAGVSFTSVSAGVEHTCGVTNPGDALCWGRNDDGQATLPAGVSFTSVSAGTAHTCGVTTSGDVFCWGRLNTVIPGPLNR